ncbi:hypothetical protein OSB04_028915 [Centaurea solstitialis]|uniref:Integrase catalytic domain-containing protein n=1 Tax=Centaurea solstitialis TaxID=347529 RepID=A0AA38SI99_9ASTR|nr:hypothetical protein OSB04_028915 [Centaurea solstitialis]
MGQTESLCAACEKGKQTRASFKSKQVSTINSPLHLLHMDLFGPVNIQSMGGKRFTLVIVDEYSRYTWVFFLRARSETPQLIIAFILRMEKYNQITIRSIRSDHGTEFKNSVLDEFLVSKGISQNFSSVRTPRKNGVVERRNRTLIEAARSMLIEARLPIQLWVGAVNTACYTQNMSLIVKRFKKTAYELIRGRKPNIEYFHIFGCNCYIKNDRDALGKFDAKADDGFLVGYSTISKAYRVFNKRRQTIEETIHVKFDESNPFFSSSFSDNNDVDQWANSYFHVPENEAPDTNIPAAGTPSPILDGFEEIPEIPQDPPAYSVVPISQDIPSTSGSSEAAPLVVDPPQLDAVAEESSSTVAAEPPQAVPQPPTLRWTRDHPVDQVLGDPSTGVRTRHRASNHCLFVWFLSENGPSKLEEALADPFWVLAMQEELAEFEKNLVWTLLHMPSRKTIMLGTGGTNIRSGKLKFRFPIEDPILNLIDTIKGVWCVYLIAKNSESLIGDTPLLAPFERVARPPWITPKNDSVHPRGHAFLQILIVKGAGNISLLKEVQIPSLLSAFGSTTSAASSHVPYGRPVTVQR